MKKILLTLGLYSISLSSGAQQPEELITEYIALVKQQNCEKATAKGDTIIKLYQQNKNDGTYEYATLLSVQGSCYLSLKQNDKAERLFIQSTSILKQLGKNREEGYINTLNSLALLYESSNDFQKAAPLLIELKEIIKREAGEANEAYMGLVKRTITAFDKSNQKEKAAAEWLHLLKVQYDISGELSWEYLDDLFEMGFFYESTGEYKKAEPGYIKAIALMRQMGDSSSADYASGLHILADLYSMMIQYEKAEPLYIKAIAIKKKELGENHQHYANSLNNLGRLYMMRGEYDKAESLYLQSGNIRKKLLGETHPDYAISLNNLALLYENMGQYEKAEPLYLQAMSIIKKTGNSDYATTSGNLANLYMKLGQPEKAEPLYLESQSSLKKLVGENHPDYAKILINLAAFYMSMGRYEEAESRYILSGNILKKTLGETDPDYAASLNNLALLYSTTGQYEKSESLYLRAKNIWKQSLGEAHPNYASCLNSLAFLYTAMGQYEKAEPLYIAAKDTWKKCVGETHPDYIANLDNLASLYELKNQYDKAVPLRMFSNKAVIQNLKNTFAILSDKEKGKYLAGKAPLIETNNSSLYNFRNASAEMKVSSFNLQLFIKSLALADTKNMLESVSNSKDSSVKKTFQSWRINKNLLARQYSLPVNSRVPGLDSIELKTEELEKELSRKSAEFRNQQKSQTVTLADVQKKLTEDEVAIEFVRFHLYNKKWTDSIFYAAYIVRKKDEAPVFVPLCEEKQLQKLFDSAGNNTNSLVSNFYRGFGLKNKNAASLGTELYKLIWAPLESYLKGVTKIAYSPAGKLYSIAFHALPADSNSVLMDKYQLRQYTGIRQVALREEEKKNSKPGAIVLFGNARFTMDSLELVKQKTIQPVKENTPVSIYAPQKRSSDNNVWDDLPGTEQEVNTIKQLFDQNKQETKSFVQTAASEENLKALNGRSPQVLHIATHGFFLPEPDKKRIEKATEQINSYTQADDPLLRNGLILAGGNYAWRGNKSIAGVEDGIATAYEISQLNLSNTELAVLSACETALGDVKGSEGVFGLQRAFKMAGVKKMIVSLWQVPDKETAELMSGFYSYWMKGKSINESFAQAQAEMRKKYSPLYWAAFVLIE